MRVFQTHLPTHIFKPKTFFKQLPVSLHEKLTQMTIISIFELLIVVCTMCYIINFTYLMFSYVSALFFSMALSSE